MRSQACPKFHRTYYVGVACVLWLFCLCGAAFAAPTEVDPVDIEHLFDALHAPTATEMPRQLHTDEGYLRFVAAPPGAYFVTGISAAKSSAPELTAQTFISAHIGAFARPSSRMSFNTARVNSGGDQSYVKLRQTYNGIPILCGEIMVQTNAFGGVVCVLSDVLRDTAPLDDGALSITPSISMDAAQAAALQWACNTFGGSQDDYTAGPGERMLYDPVVVGEPGAISLTWKFVVVGQTTPLTYEAVFVDAHSSRIVFHYPLVHDLRDRRIFDGENTYQITPDGNIISNGKLVRSEGDPPTNIVDADLAYDYFGDTYDFYSRVHGRDSIDNKGMPIVGTVRFCNPFFGCPMENAFWSGGEDDPINNLIGISTNHMYFGQGFSAADDVVGHELTHGVTENESNLIYANQSGAINESFSDIWGEYIDLTNGRGTDTRAVRWLMGEDVPGMGAIRNMANPPQFGDPDRVGSPYYYKGPLDNGGVHWNSGVINKLCYLMTDGDTFNGRTVSGMGIETTAKLFYELQIHLLTAASDFNDVYNALGQATINLAYSPIERTNVRTATLAVEIAPDTSDELITAFRAIPSIDKLGRPVIALTWNNPTSPLFKRVIIVRDTKSFPRVPTEGLEVFRGTDEKFLDTAVVAGAEYFYTIFSQLAGGFPDQRFTRAVAGTTPADFLTEVFSPGSPTPPTPANLFDLSFTQILFSPVGAPQAPVGESPTIGNYYSAYTVMVTQSISDLPVPRQDERGGAFMLPLTQNQVWPVPITVAPFPFFGVRYSKIFLGANGYIAFQDVGPLSPENLVPSLAAHFSVPRISFLFSKLAPSASGEMWARILDDRMVVTFVGVPEFESAAVPPARNPNTVQVELFYSGDIRLTYLDCNVHNAVVGLSDGQGMPQDPGLLFPGVQHVVIPSDLSQFPGNLTALTLEPIPLQNVAAGEEIMFVARTRSVPPGFPIPVLSAEWNGPGQSAPFSGAPPATQAPFADNRDGTGTFRWQTGLLNTGMFVVRIIATSGAMTAYQDVNLAVGISEPLPTASEVVLRTNDPVEDPRRDRPVDDDLALIADYHYSHPEELSNPELYAEGPTEIFWFKDNAMIPAFTDIRVVPPDATKPNEQWFFVVIPRTMSSLEGRPIEGTPKLSPVVTIAGLPRIFNVVLPEDIPAGAHEGVPLPNLPPAEGPSTGIPPTTVVILGKRLTNPISITFGGIDAQSFHAVNDFRVEAVAPAHAPSFVIGGIAIPDDLVVVTPAGATTAPEAFTFVDGGNSILKADVNRDGKVDAVDVQLVVNALLELSKSRVNADVNLDGKINAADLQIVINAAIGN